MKKKCLVSLMLLLLVLPTVVFADLIASPLEITLIWTVVYVPIICIMVILVSVISLIILKNISKKKELTEKKRQAMKKDKRNIQIAILVMNLIMSFFIGALLNEIISDYIRGNLLGLICFFIPLLIVLIGLVVRKKNEKLSNTIQILFFIISLILYCRIVTNF